MEERRASLEAEERAKLLPAVLRGLYLALGEQNCAQVEELRLREGCAPSLVQGGREETPPSWATHCVSARDISWVLEAAGQGSIHTVMDQFRSGFLAVEGGHRIGVCGSVSMKEGTLLNFRRVSSLSLRFCRSCPGIATPLLPLLLEDGRLQSTLIFSPPGGGKTTLLRDIIRCVSDGLGLAPLRVGVADERGELCGLCQGKPQRDVGTRTDVMDGCPKALSLLMLLRGMNPQVLAADEITAPEDIRAMEEVAGCGVNLLATAHGGTPEEICLRPLYRELLAREIFRRFVWIRLENGERRYRVLNREEMMDACSTALASV